MSFTNRNNFSLCSSMPGFASNVLPPLAPSTTDSPFYVDVAHWH